MSLAQPAAAASPSAGFLARLKGRDDGATAIAILLALVSAAAFFATQPRLGILDPDGFAYAMGAEDIRAGLGYRGLLGEPFNHWPPGYSLILSLFDDPIAAAWVLNGLAFGATVGLLQLLARRSGWTWQAAAGLSVGLGAGFFRLVAACVHADILTYAVFVAGLIFATARPGRTLPAALWAAMIPVKFIAVAFLPPAALADLVAAPKTFWRLALRWLPAALIAAAITAVVLAYDVATIGTWMSSSHANPSLSDIKAEAISFVVSIPREFLFSWYGPLAGIFPKVAFGVTLALLAVCALSLKPMAGGRWLRIYGAAFLVCCVVLLCVRDFDPSVRLSAYGLVALLVGFQPLRWANWAWLLYGLASLVSAGVDLATTNDLGAADPRYVQLAGEVAAFDKTHQVVATNSYRILDLYARIPSVNVTDYAQAAPYPELLRVTLPSYDATASTVAPLPAPPAGWCLAKAFPGAELYRHCAAP